MFFSHEVRPFGRGSHNPTLRGHTITMVINHLLPKTIHGTGIFPYLCHKNQAHFCGTYFSPKNSMVINQKLGWSSKTKVLTFIETMCPGRFTGHWGWGAFLLEILVAKMVVTIPSTIPIYYIPNTFWGSNWCNWIPFPPPETKALEGFLVWLEDGFPGCLGYSKLGDLTLRWRILSNLQDGCLASWGRLMTKVADQKLPTFAGSECIGVCCFPLERRSRLMQNQVTRLPSQLSVSKWELIFIIQTERPLGPADSIVPRWSVSRLCGGSSIRSGCTDEEQQLIDQMLAASRLKVFGVLYPKCSADVQIVGCNLHDLFVLACDYSPSQCQMMPNVF